jgi:predicted nucleotidyltransferase
MKTAAIIAEYNPFHLGHAWQIGAVRQVLGEDAAIIAIMSGCFTQRGEPAALDKWSRARAALACGVDLVLELPAAYATASAERFAAGGVQMAQATGLDCHLVFGSECGELEPLRTLSDLLSNEPAGYKDLLHQFLDQGDSFPAARQSAVAAWTGDPGLAGLLESSNNILAVEYLKAMQALPDCRLKPATFQRQGQAYRDSHPAGAAAGFASASAIRQCIFEHAGRRKSLSGRALPDAAGLFQALMPMLPEPSLAIVMEIFQKGPGPVFWEDLAPAVFSLLRSRPIDEIDQVPNMGEGLARRLAAAAGRPGEKQAGSPAEGILASLLWDAATRRFPQTRIQRALLSLLLGLRAEDAPLFDSAGGPQYIRVLGFSRQGRHLLKIMRRLAERPVLMKGSDILEHRDPAFCRMAELDVLSTDIWMTAAGLPCGKDFDTPVVMR